MEKSELLALSRPIVKEDLLQSIIYFLFKGDEVVYVGQSKHGVSRVFAHIHQSPGDYKKSFDRFTITPCEESELNNLEAFYVLKFKPKYNKVFPKSDKYVNAFHYLQKSEIDKMIAAGCDYVRIEPGVYMSITDLEHYYAQIKAV
ncbi:GIY-YIG nuclease family protein [Anaeroselena agilis]|uniref:GIY-YIG nuclease family protein n=1 Tax=Anaeroselena agilis TaxID=3063788 RepID=A0ABU3NWE9_9FIRM|nr:GIY-YIG nuclease family protein [Selenomonadales bacterium 4137-cl]